MSTDNSLAHLTPRTLVGQRFPSDFFGDVKVALVGYCPPPANLSQYNPVGYKDQPFIHLAPEHVHVLSHQGRRLLSLSHVYGGPVSSAVVEELAYYGVDTILAYGLCGGLGTKMLAMGDIYLAESSFVADGTAPRYTDQSVVRCDQELADRICDQWDGGIVRVQAATVDAIYREDDAYLQSLRDKSCDIIHIDTSHLYAVSLNNAEGRRLRSVQCGVVSDVVADGALESALSAVLSENADQSNPLDGIARILEFYVERISKQL